MTRNDLWRLCWFPALVLMFFTVGCKKVYNTNPDLIEHRRHFLFMNYSVERPPMKGAEEDAPDGGWEFTSREFVGDKLRVLLRRGTIPYEIVQQFAKESGASVAVEYFDENIEAYDRMQHNEMYDVVMPGYYLLGRLRDNNVLGKMELKWIPNVQQISKDFQKLNEWHDPSYSLAYLWTVSGIAYHYEYFDDRPHSWREFFEPGPDVLPWVEGKMSIQPSPRQNFAAALVRLGYSPNSENSAEIDAAERYLMERMSKYQLVDHSDLRQAFLDQTVVMAQATSADVALTDNSNIMFSVPQDGTWLHLDMLAISGALQDERKKKLAHAFINYMLRPVVSALVVEYSRHASTVDRATVFIRPAIRNSVAYIRGEKSKTFVLHGSGRTEQLQEEAARRFHPLAQEAPAAKNAIFASDPLPTPAR